MSQYAVEIDLSRSNTSHAQVADLVGTGKRVLDVGCWTGDLGRALATRGCTVSGFEIDEDAAAIASEHLAEVVIGDLDSDKLSAHFAAGSVDVVVFADVLEHLRDPQAVLADAATLLAPDGRVVISIPNVSHGSLRLALLQGRWRTTDTGLLDATHIRFFTRESLVDMVRGAGLVVDDLRGVLADPLRTEVEIDESRLPRLAAEWVRDQPDALVYQFQLAARLRRPDEVQGDAPDLAMGADPADVRVIDQHTGDYQKAEAEQRILDEQLPRLRERQARLAEKARRRMERIERLRAKVATQDERIAELEREIERLRGAGVLGLARRVKRRLAP